MVLLVGVCVRLLDEGALWYDFDVTAAPAAIRSSVCRAECELLECSECSGGTARRKHKSRCEMQANTASEHSEALIRLSRACFTVYNLVSYCTLEWRFLETSGRRKQIP